MSARLTNVSESGKPPYPITINPNHVVEVKPRFRPIPNQGSQVGGLLPHYEGSQLRLVTGDYVRVIEDYQVVHERLWPQQQPPSSPEPAPVKKAPAKKAMPKVAEEKPIPQSQISGLTEAITEAEKFEEKDED
jgi:hypothetical protein